MSSEQVGTNPDVRELVTEATLAVLEAHRSNYRNGNCVCGWVAPWNLKPWEHSTIKTAGQHVASKIANRVLAVLAEHQIHLCRERYAYEEEEGRDFFVLLASPGEQG